MTVKHSFQTQFAVPLSCEGCVTAVSDQLYKLGGITKVEGNLQNQLISVEGSAAPSAIVEAIQATGRDAILRGSGASDSAAVSILETFADRVERHDNDDQDRDVRGLARMVQVSPERTLVDLTVRGVAPGTYRATIRAYGDLKDGATSTGPVWSGDNGQDKGTLGVVRVGEDGRGAAFVDHPFQIWEVIGHAMVLTRQDEEASKPLHNDENTVVGVIARSAGMWENDKTSKTFDEFNDVDAPLLSGIVSRREAAGKSRARKTIGVVITLSSNIRVASRAQTLETTADEMRHDMKVSIFQNEPVYGHDWLTGSQLPTERRHEVNIRRVCMVGAVWQVDGPSSKSVSPPRVYKMAPRIEPRWHQVQVYIARMRCLGARCGEGILELGGAHAGGARPISCLMIIRSGHLGVAKFLDLGERSEVHLKAQTSTRGCLLFGYHSEEKQGNVMVKGRELARGARTMMASQAVFPAQLGAFHGTAHGHHEFVGRDGKSRGMNKPASARNVGWNPVPGRRCIEPALTRGASKVRSEVERAPRGLHGTNTGRRTRTSWLPVCWDIRWLTTKADDGCPGLTTTACLTASGRGPLAPPPTQRRPITSPLGPAMGTQGAGFCNALRPKRPRRTAPGGTGAPWEPVGGTHRIGPAGLHRNRPSRVGSGKIAREPGEKVGTKNVRFTEMSSTEFRYSGDTSCWDAGLMWLVYIIVPQRGCCFIILLWMMDVGCSLQWSFLPNRVTKQMQWLANSKVQNASTFVVRVLAAARHVVHDKPDGIAGPELWHQGYVRRMHAVKIPQLRAEQETSLVSTRADPTYPSRRPETRQKIFEASRLDHPHGPQRSHTSAASGCLSPPLPFFPPSPRPPHPPCHPSHPSSRDRERGVGFGNRQTPLAPVSRLACAFLTQTLGKSGSAHPLGHERLMHDVDDGSGGWPGGVAPPPQRASRWGRGCPHLVFPTWQAGPVPSDFSIVGHRLHHTWPALRLSTTDAHRTAQRNL
ncbi:hypothetical protein Purlil1_10536 [Purpureocillium lilacinum]|uniref:Superoxide dismutase 1 copper chaperone n=1 Tax=Purpureocillium lilacinum TaxID=33203 RepID=A0ABR0BMB9_PURLI|nr:hypothetical protein Purlil1_10536 [Purpureocillium lilacinum]